MDPKVILRDDMSDNGFADYQGTCNEDNMFESIRVWTSTVV